MTHTKREVSIKEQLLHYKKGQEKSYCPQMKN